MRKLVLFMLLVMVCLVVVPLSGAQASDSATIQKCKVKAGKGKKGEPFRGLMGFIARDSISFSGLLDAAAGDIDNADEIVVTIDSEYMSQPLPFAFPINDSTFKKGKYRYTSPKVKGDKNAPKTSFKFNPRKDKFTFVAKNVNLTGLDCPMWVRVQIGAYVAQVQLGETIVNRKKLIPIQLMWGVKDNLIITKHKIKNGKNPSTDSISVKGVFTIAGAYKRDMPVTIGLGSSTFTVAGGKFVSKGFAESCKASANEGPLVSAKFDASKCTFTISIKNAAFSGEGRIDFSIDLFDNYLPSQTILYEFEGLRHYARPQDRGSWWNYDADYTMTGIYDESGSTNATLRIGSSPRYIDGRACNEVKMSASGGSTSSWWYKDNLGVHMMGQRSNALWNFDIQMSSALTVPKFLQTGKQYKDSGSFHGSIDGVFDVGFGNSIEIGSFNGKASLTAKVLGEEPISVPAGSYASAVKVEETVTMNGKIPIEGTVCGQHFKGTMKYIASAHQIWWSVPEIGIVKVNTTITIKLSFKGESESLKITETDVLTSYGPQ